MPINIGGLDKLISDPMTPNFIQVTSVVEHAVADEGTYLGPGAWMFVVMAIVFILVLKFGRKKTHLHETVRPVLNNRKKNSVSGIGEDNK